MKILLAMMILTLLSCTNEGGNHAGHNNHDSTVTGGSSKKSLPAEAKASIAGANLSIRYHAPAVRERVIWGGLVPYDAVWVAGAHNATTLEVDKNFVVGQREIPSGKYALFTIPGKEEWTIIINKNWDQHLADEYKEADDVVRVKVKPEKSDMTERLTYRITSSGDKAALVTLQWEQIKVGFGINIQ